MSGFSGVYYVQTTGFHGVVEDFLNTGGKVFQKEGDKYSYKGTEKRNIGKIVVLSLLFFLTIPALMIMACSRASLNNNQIMSSDSADLEKGTVSVDSSKNPSIKNPMENTSFAELRATFNQMLRAVRGGEIVQDPREFERMSEVVAFGTGKLYLHGMTVNNWGGHNVPHTVAVHGRQDPANYEWPPEKHSALQTSDVHYFHPDLAKMDVMITLDKTPNTEASEELARSVADSLLNVAFQEGNGSFKGFTIYSEDIEYLTEGKSGEEIVANLTRIIRDHVLINNDRSTGRTLKLLVNFEPGREAEIERKFSSELGRLLSMSDDISINKIKSSKDCTSSYFAGEEGKANIKRAVSYIIDKLEKGEEVSIWCHQGKDRSAAIVFATLLYLSGDARPANQAKVLQYLRSQRTIVSDYAKPSEQRNFMGPMVAAVAEMLEEERS